eukprot:366079-Chlamydomonas_euryale.AAC.5
MLFVSGTTTAHPYVICFWHNHRPSVCYLFLAQPPPVRLSTIPTYKGWRNPRHACKHASHPACYLAPRQHKHLNTPTAPLPECVRPTQQERARQLLTHPGLAPQKRKRSLTQVLLPKSATAHPEEACTYTAQPPTHPGLAPQHCKRPPTWTLHPKSATAHPTEACTPTEHPPHPPRSCATSEQQPPDWQGLAPQQTNCRTGRPHASAPPNRVKCRQRAAAARLPGPCTPTDQLPDRAPACVRPTHPGLAPPASSSRRRARHARCGSAHLAACAHTWRCRRQAPWRRAATAMPLRGAPRPGWLPWTPQRGWHRRPVRPPSPWLCYRQRLCAHVSWGRRTVRRATDARNQRNRPVHIDSTALADCPRRLPSQTALADPRRLPSQTALETLADCPRRLPSQTDLADPRRLTSQTDLAD